MDFREETANAARPDSIWAFSLPRRANYYPSAVDWREEVLYLVLPDRFSDGHEDQRPLLDRNNLSAARGEDWNWERWYQSGADHWQGGTLKGVESKLDYLCALGITAIWLGPVFKQRGHLNTFHGYGIQDFLDVDPRLGTRKDLVDLVDAAHAKGLRVILDTIFNHSGANWTYPDETAGGEFAPDYTQGHYPFGSWRGADGNDVDAIHGPEDGVWPVELQNPESYTRAGTGDLAAGNLDDPNAEYRRTDFEDMRSFELNGSTALYDLIQCYKYWIALSDCDGFRLDTLKHVSMEEARLFCSAIKEYATNLGKVDFVLIGEICGGDYNEDRYLHVLDRNLNAALDIGEMRLELRQLALGLVAPVNYFGNFDGSRICMGGHRTLGFRHISILDDHDHVFGEKLRFRSSAISDAQLISATAIQLLTLGIPCLYYGTEQGFSGPEPDQRHLLPNWGNSDAYLRESMFGPEHPRKNGLQGLPKEENPYEPELPGFGPFGTSGYHTFDQENLIFKCISAIAKLRGTMPVLRFGRQYLRAITLSDDEPFRDVDAGELTVWSRVLDDEEAICATNLHGYLERGGMAMVDPALNPPGNLFTVLLSTAQILEGEAYNGHYQPGTTLTVEHREDGTAFVRFNNLKPSEVLIIIRPMA